MLAAPRPPSPPRPRRRGRQFTDRQGIAAKFEAKTGHKASLSFGSSGQFYTQIATGAVRVFCRPHRAAQKPRPTVSPCPPRASPMRRAAVCEQSAGLVDGRGAVLSKGTFQKIAIADPKAAPMPGRHRDPQEVGLYDRLTPKLVPARPSPRPISSSTPARPSWLRCLVQEPENSQDGRRPARDSSSGLR